MSCWLMTPERLPSYFALGSEPDQPPPPRRVPLYGRLIGAIPSRRAMAAAIQDKLAAAADRRRSRGATAM